jgi:hypothetical protein
MKTGVPTACEALKSTGQKLAKSHIICYQVSMYIQCGEMVSVSVELSLGQDFSADIEEKPVAYH